MTQAPTHDTPPVSVPPVNSPSSNPYVGPRPFTRAERDRFFGRDQEASRLIPLVIAERLVVFYAQSGAGKSSLINARLIPGLEERNFQVISGRVSGQAESNVQANNVYMYNLLLSLEQGQHRVGPAPEPAELASMTLSQYLSELEVAAQDPGSDGDEENPGRPLKVLVDAPQIVGGVQPLALIIDQFEELFTTNPGAWAQREPFFQQLCEAMLDDPYLWVVLAIREDYIALLDPYADLVPGKLRSRFYMQRMSAEAAMEAVRRPVEKLRPFEEGAAGELVKNLSLIAVGRDYTDQQQIQYEFGQFVEPVQLQVVCYQLWDELKRHPGERITQQDLNSLAKNQTLAEFISNALADFYEQALREVLKVHPEVSERKLRGWFSSELVTEMETRSAVLRGSEVTGKPPYDLPNEVVRSLQDHFIIRSEIRGENTWYELSHDRFVGPILQANRRWAASNPRLFESDARAWEEAGRPPAKLYEGRQLQAALDYADQNPDELTEVERDFINQSQKSAARKQTRRQIAIYAIVGLVMLALGFLSVRSQQGWNTANVRLTSVIAANSTANAAFQELAGKNGEIATALGAQQKASTSEAQKNSTAIAALSTSYVANTQAAYQSQLAVEQKSTAQVASTKAVYEATQAGIQKAAADAANLQSQGSRLASLSDYFRLSNLKMSLLLAVHGVRLNDSWETRRALFDTLQRGLKTQLDSNSNGIFTGAIPYTVAFSPNGDLIAAGLTTGEVSVWSVDGQGAGKQPPGALRLDFPVQSVAFDPSGNTLVVAGGGPKVLFWDMTNTDNSKNVTSLEPFGSYAFNAKISAVAYQPGGSLLAMAGKNDSGAGQLLFFNTATKKVVEPNLDCGAPAVCTSLAWNKDGNLLAVGNSYGNIHIFDVKSATEILRRTQLDNGHAAPVVGLAWYRDNQRLVSGGLENRLIQWDTAAKKPIRIADRNVTPIVSSLAISPDGRYLAVGSSDPKDAITVWDAETMQRLSYPILVNAHRQGVQAVAFSAVSNRFASAAADTYIKVWNFTPIDPLSAVTWQVPAAGRVDDLGVDASGQLLAAETVGSQLSVWTQGAQKPQVIPSAHGSAALGMLNGAPVVLLGGFDGQVTFVDPATGKPARDPVKVGVATIRAVALSPDGKWLAAGVCSSGTCTSLVAADLTNPAAKPLTVDLSSYKGSITALAFSQDSKQVAVGTDQGMIFVVQLADNTVTQLMTDGIGLGTVKLQVTSLAFSPVDVGLLAAGFLDNRVALWDLASQSPVGAFDERMSGEVTSMFFRQDAKLGLQLVSSSNRGEVRTWEIDEAAWIQRACDRAQSSLTQDERRRYDIPADQPDACPAYPAKK